MNTSKPKKKYRAAETPKTERGRLTALVKFLEEILEREPEVFDLSDWFTGFEDRDPEGIMEEWQKRYRKYENLNCGTSACVAGLLPVRFPDSFEVEGFLDVEIRYVYENADADVRFRTVDLEGLELADFFGGLPEEWERIICPGFYPDDPGPTLGAVIDRIKETFALK